MSSSYSSVAISPKKQGLDSPKTRHDYSKTRRTRITLFVLLLVLIIFAIIIVTLALTIFKPKDPLISVSPVGLEDFDMFSANESGVPLGMVITIGNENYGGFKYINSTGYIQYHDTVVAEVPLVSDFIPARSKFNVSTYAGIMTYKLLGDQRFLSDVGTGGFNCTAKATLPGKMIALKIFKIKASVSIACDISFKIDAVLGATSNCTSKIKV